MEPLATLFDEARGALLPLPPELAALHGALRMPYRPDRAHVFTNFVASVDGIVAVDPPRASGAEISGGNGHDRAVMGLLRAVADGVVIGAGNLRAEGDHVWTAERICPELSGPYARLRAALGKTPAPLQIVVSGSGDGESGLQVSPWWSHDVDGRLNVRTTDGEIAAFGGRLPFYSFTASQGLHYVKGTTIGVELAYHPNGLSQDSPATIEYIVRMGGNEYTSGPLAFDEGNPGEGYGSWGMLDDTRVGAHLQVFLTPGVSTDVTATWSSILYNPGPTATENTTWGNMKGLYR